ncbi:MAG: hypothetical protein AMS17_11395 [Spirochaetes bacterium DG_61]|nr:MAG: hypothetical protein AMS17_11395 [Spirochaetes bacterium DG_61]
MHTEIQAIKKELHIHKIVGLMMLHYFKWPWCLEDLSNYVDEIYLLIHQTPEFKGSWHTKVPKVMGTTEITLDHELPRVEFRKQGNREKFRETAIRMLDEVRPELVFFPDEDEAFPESEFLAKDLVRFYRSKKMQLGFRRINFWDSMETVRKDHWTNVNGPHTRIFKWQPGLTYYPYIGYNRISSYGKKQMVARTAMKHYAFMDREEREWRYKVLFKGQEKIYKKLLKKPKLVKYTNAKTAPRT